MGGLKEIRRRISSVKNTKQITRAMKLVSAAKLRRAQEAAEGGRSFGERLQDVLRTVRADLPENFSHPLLEVREEVRKRRVVVIAGERGLCGAYNANVIKAIKANRKNADCEMDFVVIGQRALSAANREKWPVVASHVRLPDEVSDWSTSEWADDLIGAFSSGEVDEVVVYYTTFKSAMTQVVTRDVLLPFAPPEALKKDKAAPAEQTEVSLSKYDPTPDKIVGQLLPLLVKTQLCQAAMESKASEHAARMTAMDSATRNADELIEKLRLYYNRARQSAITTELIDIVGGAEAIK